MGQSLTGKILKQKRKTRIKHCNSTSLPPAQQQNMAIHPCSDTPSIQSSQSPWWNSSHIWFSLFVFLSGSESFQDWRCVAQWLPTQTLVKSTGLWFCIGKYLLPTCCNVKAKFCSLQNTIRTSFFLNAFWSNFQLVYPPVFPHLIAIRWFNKNTNNPHQNKSRWKGVLVKMFSSLNSGNHIYSNTHLLIKHK